MKMRIWNMAGFRDGELVGHMSHPVPEEEPEGSTAQWMASCALKCWFDADKVIVKSRGKSWQVELDHRKCST